jgi:hypothetical protein
MILRGLRHPSRQVTAPSSGSSSHFQKLAQNKKMQKMNFELKNKFEHN